MKFTAPLLFALVVLLFSCKDDEQPTPAIENDELADVAGYYMRNELGVLFEIAWIIVYDASPQLHEDPAHNCGRTFGAEYGNLMFASPMGPRDTLHSQYFVNGIINCTAELDQNTMEAQFGYDRTFGGERVAQTAAATGHFSATGVLSLRRN